MLRSAFLYLAGQQQIFKFVRNNGLAKSFANRFVAGETLDTALAAVARLNERNNWLVDSHHPLRETILLQTGMDAKSRASFLRSRQKIARDALIHEWDPTEAAVIA